MGIKPQDIIDFLRNNARQPANVREMLRHFGLSGKERKPLSAQLDALVQDGAIVELRGNRYALPRKISLVVGKISVHRDGYGFVASGREGDEDLFVPARYLREAMHGDLVQARVERSRRDGRREGRVIKVLERSWRTVVGRFEQGHRFGYVTPEDPRLLHDIYIPPDATGEARQGQLVVVRIESYPSKARNAEGMVIEVLGDPDDPRVEAQTIILKHALPYRFSAEALGEAESVPAEVSAAERPGREDLRHLPTVTIDGETARDFDDAVAVQREPSGQIRLWVSIADVAHYVPEGSALDRDALERGTSVYFPGQCIPMLPERLSNGICSLNPHVDRLTMTAELLFDRDGHRLQSRFYPSVIRSSARLTYTEVSAMLVGREETVIDRYRELFAQLQVMEELALRLMAMRRKRGSLDFDLPEAEVVLDLTGQPEDIVRAERTLAHRIIEEFMLAANEAVATFVAARDVHLLYRVHEPPEVEKLQDFQAFVAHFNFGLHVGSDGVDPGDLQRLLSEVEGRPEERMINQVLLRSMKQAHYTPENIGHFGLAADLYCHFTSPIRRYPDLVVHRILKEVLEQDRFSERRKTELESRLPRTGELTSSRERRAMEAEREIVELKKCRFMLEHTGEEFAGIVSGVMPFGFFVELEEVFVEGLVHIGSLVDDFYFFEEAHQRLVGENRRRIFQVGEPVRIIVKDVNLARREIDFTLVDMEPPSRSRKRRKKG